MIRTLRIHDRLASNCATGRGSRRRSYDRSWRWHQVFYWSRSNGYRNVKIGELALRGFFLSWSVTWLSPVLRMDQIVLIGQQNLSRLRLPRRTGRYGSAFIVGYDGHRSSRLKLKMNCFTDSSIGQIEQNYKFYRGRQFGGHIADIFRWRRGDQIGI